MHRPDPDYPIFKRENLPELLGQWVFSFVLCGLVQLFWQAHSAEFWHADDGAHYVSSSMIANWLVSGLGDPMSAALDYNTHYPLVSIGLWGPAFYALFGAAIAVLGAGKIIALCLTAAVMAGLATLTSWMVSRVASREIAWTAAALLTLLPLSVDQSLAFGLDAPVSLAIGVAMVALGEHLLENKQGYLVLLLVAALTGLLTKGNALALYLYAPLVLYLTQRWAVLRTWRIWAVVVLISLLAVPWYLFSYQLTARGFRESWGWAFTSRALFVNLQLLYLTIGPWLAILALWGASRSLTRPSWGAVFLASSLSFYLFQSVVPASLNARYLLPMLPFVLALAALGWVDLSRRVPTRWRKATTWCALLGLVLTTASLDYPKSKIYHGVGGAAAELRSLMPKENRSVLIVGFDVVETAFISEMAMRQPMAPDVFILRGSKLLGGGGYNNFEYKPLYPDSDAVLEALRPYRLPLIVISRAGRADKWEHIAQVQNLLERPDSGWRVVWHSDGQDDVRIYLNDANALQPEATAEIRTLAMPKRVVFAPSP